tara:strand:- start:229 stop:1248 length:1020 start_codon:yes stop_codon:yes gene_type:complete
MIVKNYEIINKIPTFLKKKIMLLYGENFGLKKDIQNLIKTEINKKDSSIESQFFYENEIYENEENFFNNLYSGSLFSNQKILTIYDGSDKIVEIINTICEKKPENIYLLIFSEVLDKKSKLRAFFEKNDDVICVPCYLDTERDLETIARNELAKNNINLSKETLNLLIEKSNSDRNNLKNEIEKIRSYSLNKKNLSTDEIKLLINFSGDYKSDILINECLCGNTSEYKKIISEMYANTINQILFIRILNNKIQRLLKIKSQESKTNNLDSLINTTKPAIFWKEKPIVKKQLLIWGMHDLNKLVDEANNTELLCKKNPKISKAIFFKFFSSICEKASNFS